MLTLYQGDVSQACSFAQDLQQLPMSGPSEQLLANIYIQEVLLHARQYEASLDLKAAFLSANPNCIGSLDACRVLFNGAVAHEMIGQCQDALHTLAIAENCKQGELQAEWQATLWVQIAEAMVQSSMGEEAAAIRCLEELKQEASAREIASARAVLSFRLGLIDDGFKCLAQALDNHDWFLLTIKTHPWFDLVRDDPRFADVLMRMNLVDEERE